MIIEAMLMTEAWRFRRRDILYATAALGITAADGAAEEASAGIVTAVTGEATAQLRAKTRVLALEGLVFVGDRVATGAAARAAMTLGRDTSLRLGEYAKLTIDRYLANAGGVITIGAGAILLDREPGPGKEPIRIRSPYGQIAVRGTQVFAGPSNGVFGIFVARGRVVVTAASSRVVLTEGEGTDIPRPGAAPTPVRRWGDARIRATLDQVR